MVFRIISINNSSPQPNVNPAIAMALVNVIRNGIYKNPLSERWIRYLGLADYLTGASNSRKRSRDSPVRTGQPLDDDAEVEDASEK
jgi:hypothetical protein